MSKIPVGATIAQTYRFVFRDFFKIVSIAWLPLLILSLLSLLLFGALSSLSRILQPGILPISADRCPR